MHASIAPLAAILDLDTDLLLNCLEGLSEEDARRRLPGGGNSAAFLAAHLTDSRHFLAARLERPLTNPLSRYLADARGIEDVLEWPGLDLIRSAWLAVSRHLANVLAMLDGAALLDPESTRFPLGDGTRLGVITFLVHHDSYHLGQLAFVRRQLGHPAMSYERGRSKSVHPGALA